MESRRRHRPLSWPNWLLLLWLLCIAPALHSEPRQQVLELRLALAVPAAGEQFPDTRLAVPRTLPDHWADWRDDSDGPVWYRVSFDAAAPDGELLAVYIARVCSSFDLQLNGHWLVRASQRRGPDRHLCNAPQLVVLPGALLQPGSNRLDLRVVGDRLSQVASRAHSGGLSALEIGPQALLAPRHALATALQVGLPQAISATLLLMGSFMFLLGWRHRNESHLAYFGALSIGWALVEARRWLTVLPFTNAVAEFLLSFTLALVTLAAVQFLLRYARWRSPHVGRLLALQCALMPASLVLAGPGRLHLLASIWVAVFALEIAAAAAFHLQLRQRQQGLRWPSVALLGAVLAALAVELLARVADLPPLLAHGARLVVPLALVLVGLRLVQRHGHALQASEASRVNLEGRIRDATLEIERNFKQLTELRVEQVTERERKRIAADLHDDLGAKLLTIVHTSEDARISTLAREALEEMRLSVRGLTGKPVRLADALGDWRAELMSRLSQSGIEGEWSSPDDLPQTLSARAYVQTTRILRESTSNIIKHSGASRCVIEVTIFDGDLQLLIQDNGNGIPMELDGRLDRGHGMASMKHRAKQMQGQCLVESGPGFGTVIRLTLPLDRATEPAP
jgi:signal transduction histidine kinase